MPALKLPSRIHKIHSNFLIHTYTLLCVSTIYINTYIIQQVNLSTATLYRSKGLVPEDSLKKDNSDHQEINHYRRWPTLVRFIYRT